jgi:hypothetical protein
MIAGPGPGARGRIRLLRSLIARPADVRLLCRMVPWAAALPLLKHVVRLGSLARLMWMDPKSKARPETAKVLALSRVLAPPARISGGACYERSLLAYRFLSERGADPRLVVAVKKNGGAVIAHAWVTVDGTAVGESEAIDDFVPVIVYGRGGRSERGAEGNDPRPRRRP